MSRVLSDKSFEKDLEKLLVITDNSNRDSVNFLSINELSKTHEDTYEKNSSEDTDNETKCYTKTQKIEAKIENFQAYQTPDNKIEGLIKRRSSILKDKSVIRIGLNSQKKVKFDPHRNIQIYESLQFSNDNSFCLTPDKTDGIKTVQERQGIKKFSPGGCRRGEKEKKPQ